MTTDTNTEDLDALYPYDPNDPDPEETTRMRGYLRRYRYEYLPLMEKMKETPRTYDRWLTDYPDLYDDTP